MAAPEREHAEHPGGGDVVGQVLDNGQRLRIGPVQVLEQEQAAPAFGLGENRSTASPTTTGSTWARLSPGRLHSGTSEPRAAR